MLRLPVFVPALLSFVVFSAASLFAGHTRPAYLDGCQSMDGRYVVTAEPIKEKALSTTVDPTCDGVHHGAIGNRIIAAEFLKAVGMNPRWQKFPVTVPLGNVSRNIGYPPRGKGTITIEPKKDFYQVGEKINISVKPDDGQMFSGWRGSIESKEPTVTYTVDGPAFIEAIVEAPVKKK